MQHLELILLFHYLPAVSFLLIVSTTLLQLPPRSKDKTNLKMLLNYHELAIDESRDSPARRKQFLVICAVIVTFTLHSIFTSGLLLPVEVKQATFPGGEFIHKHSRRDYAASMSLLHHVAGDLKIKERHYEDIMYNVYLDDPLVIMGRAQRFASGILLNDSTKTTQQETNEERKSILMGKNQEITEPTPEEIKELPTYELWGKLKYHSHEFPQVKAAVVQFSFTNGFVSALIHSYKVCCAFYGILNIA